MHASSFFGLITLLAFFMTCIAAPMNVYVPTVLYPHKSSVWQIGSRHNVTWDASSPPSQLSNPYGMIVLRKDGRLLLDRPLANGFSILDGRYEVTVPDVEPGEYQICLFGDSGNYGEVFNITN
ncbi:hypothetical protein FISHEDRAFT_49802 [Fistulina hepatica ATCC 64428]|uniref:Uncharacterized protein n=1 Tax=Fistulina hepatica ATCC 64428 TaxID=1128425 RepID=A0A0D7A471_9AGAR|nr:hypothetical protein FISHEDRAFT_49802 [Fistulina hepatica ATCC 64428]